MRVLLVLMLLVCLAAATESVAASPSGKWKGKWYSNPTGHQGALRARIRQTGPDSYRAVFAGRFAVVVPFIYSANLQRVPGSCDEYRSSKRLPIVGTYSMSARVSNHRFFATFRSKKDTGTFDLRR